MALETLKRRIPSVSGVLIALLLATSAAGSIVTNGGFETGDFTGWTVTGADSPCFPNSQYCGVSSANDPNYPILVDSGTYAAYFGPVDAETYLNQTLSLAPSTSYTLTFSLDHFLPPDQPTYTNFFGVYFNGVGSGDGTPLFTESNAPDSGGYQSFSLNFSTAASDNSDLLQFAFEDDIGYFFIDNVSVAPNVPAVPEPASLILLPAGLACLAARARFRAVTLPRRN